MSRYRACICSGDGTFCTCGASLPDEDEPMECPATEEAVAELEMWGDGCPLCDMPSWEHKGE